MHGLPAETYIHWNKHGGSVALHDVQVMLASHVGKSCWQVMVTAHEQST